MSLSYVVWKCWVSSVDTGAGIGFGRFERPLTTLSTHLAPCDCAAFAFGFQFAGQSVHRFAPPAGPCATPSLRTTFTARKSCVRALAGDAAWTLRPRSSFAKRRARHAPHSP